MYVPQSRVLSKYIYLIHNLAGNYKSPEFEKADNAINSSEEAKKDDGKNEQNEDDPNKKSTVGNGKGKKNAQKRKNSNKTKQT